MLKYMPINHINYNLSHALAVITLQGLLVYVH